jgi:hypothetical protein
VQTVAGISWLRLALEACAIVGSILLAFAIDAAWEYRRERMEERESLLRLLDEFEANRGELARTRDAYAHALPAAREVLTYGMRTLTPEDSAHLRGRLLEAVGILTFDPGSGALQSLLASGTLERIEDRELRTHLASWSGRMNDYKEDERQAAYVANREVIPWLDPVVPLPVVEEANGHVHVVDLQGALRDLRFLNRVGRLVYAIEVAAADATAMATEIDTTIALLERELRRSE